MKKLWIAFAAGVLGISLVTGRNLYLKPSPLTFAAVKLHQNAHQRSFWDRSQRLLAVEPLEMNSRSLEWIALGEIPNVMQNAVIQIEDSRFYSHAGVDFIALGALPFHWLASGRIRGASTLTMQLVGLIDNDLKTHAWPLVRKGQQIIAAMRIERSWSKREILEAYLNLIPLKGDLKGLRAGSQGLFQKEPHGLTAEESYILASLIAAPNSHSDRIARKACFYLHLSDCGPLQKRVTAVLQHRPELPRKEAVASHFIRFLASEKTTVATTLDKTLQIAASAAIADQMALLKQQHVSDAAVLVADYQTGEVLAYVGSSGAYSKSPEVDGVQALRQAGSTLKPLLYAAAFDANLLRPETLLNDSPLQLATPQGLYTPQNYDDTYRGVIPVREALAASLNIPAVRTIGLLGVDRFYRVLEDLGFTLASRQTYGESLALGALDVSLWQLVEAYGVLARGGRNWSMVMVKDNPRPKADPPVQLFSEGNALAVARILSDKDNRQETFGLDNSLATPYPTSVKTGTSKDMRDNWCIGFSRRFVVGVWVGNFDGSPMWNVSGTTGAAPIWRTMMDSLHGKEFIAVSPNAPNHETPVLRPRAIATRTIQKILYPPDQTIVAFDPDIPPAQQVLTFETDGVLPGRYRWRLDGRTQRENSTRLSALGDGVHRLELLDINAQVLDQVEFQLRGRTQSTNDP